MPPGDVATSTCAQSFPLGRPLIRTAQQAFFGHLHLKVVEDVGYRLFDILSGHAVWIINAIRLAAPWTASEWRGIW